MEDSVEKDSVEKDRDDIVFLNDKLQAILFKRLANSGRC